MAEKVISTAEFISLRDKFSKVVMKEGRYTAGQIDNEWTNEIKEYFLKWLDQNPGLARMTRAELEKFMEKRTW